MRAYYGLWYPHHQFYEKERPYFPSLSAGCTREEWWVSSSQVPYWALKEVKVPRVLITWLRDQQNFSTVTCWSLHRQKRATAKRIDSGACFGVPGSPLMVYKSLNFFLSCFPSYEMEITTVDTTKDYQFSSVQSVAQSCPTLCNTMDCSTPGFPPHHQLPELAQTHVHCVGDAIQPSHPPVSPSLVFNLSQHQGLFQ